MKALKASLNGNFIVQFYISCFIFWLCHKRYINFMIINFIPT